MDSQMDGFNHCVDEVLLQVNQLEQRVDDIEQFYSDNNKNSVNSSRACSVLKDKLTKTRARHGGGVVQKQQQQDGTSREGAASRRMQELLHQFATILQQISQLKWASPFMEPVDVKGLGLKDYYEIIEKPMDLSTIKQQLEANDGGYKHVREACADVRLVFKNAMKYNNKKNRIHVMAKSLLAKFEEKWLQLLPKVIEEERQAEEEEAETQEAAYAKMSRNTSEELSELDKHLEELREHVVLNWRKMTREEKRQLGTALTRLSPEDLSKALEIVAQGNPSFQPMAEEVDLDIDAQSETTLWRLKFFVKGALVKPSASAAGGDKKNNNSKRKRDVCESVARTAAAASKKKTKKLG